MDDEDNRKRARAHELGMPLDALSVEELQARITALEEEIVRLRGAIDARDNTRRAAEAAFKL